MAKIKRRNLKWMRREAERMNRALEVQKQISAELPDDPTAQLVAGVALSAIAAQVKDKAQGQELRTASAMLVGSWATGFFQALAGTTTKDCDDE